MPIDTGEAGRAFPSTMGINDSRDLTLMEARITEAEPVLFLMAEVVRKNFHSPALRHMRLCEAFCGLVGCQPTNTRVREMVRKELARC